MTQEQPILSVSKVARVATDAARDVTKLYSKVAPNREYFDQLMAAKTHRQEKLEHLRVQQAKQPTPMEVATQVQLRVDRSQRASSQQILAQAQNAVQKIESVKRKLSAPNLQLKNSVQNVLRNKLTHVEESLRIALSKVGADYEAAPAGKGLLGPVKKFIGYLTHSQGQLNNFSSEVAELSKREEKLSPAVVLGLHIKMGIVQQEVEFFSSALNKALESTKTLMNIQV